MDKRLEEQLARVWQLSARVGQIHEQLIENTALMSRDREQMSGSQLEKARDVRHWRGAGRDAMESTRRVRAIAADRPAKRRRR